MQGRGRRRGADGISSPELPNSRKMPDLIWSLGGELRLFRGVQAGFFYNYYAIAVGLCPGWGMACQG
jgi:hypothetical protein